MSIVQKAAVLIRRGRLYCLFPNDDQPALYGPLADSMGPRETCSRDVALRLMQDKGLEGRLETSPRYYETRGSRTTRWFYYVAELDGDVNGMHDARWFSTEEINDGKASVERYLPGMMQSMDVTLIGRFLLVNV